MGSGVTFCLCFLEQIWAQLLYEISEIVCTCFPSRLLSGMYGVTTQHQVASQKAVAKIELKFTKICPENGT